ncbi:MAG: radical SAM protein [Acidobacteriota bacterium]
MTGFCDGGRVRSRGEEAIQRPRRGTLAARIRSGARRRVASVARSLATPLAALAEPRPAVLASARGFSGEVVLYAPLYLSSACLNDCAYCGFRKSLRIPRRKLSLDEAISEARVLESRGHRTIDLVTGEIPTDRFVAYVADVVTAIRGATAIRTINLNLGALLQDQLARLRDAGASAYHIYQETYDPGVYAAVHGPGPKRDMAFRLATAHRAAEAGFESVGLGILLGLAPLSEDLAALASHAALLRRTFPALGIGFSLPRIQDVELGPSFATPAPVGDAVFARAVLYLRTTFPRAHVSITTREAPAIRDALMRLGATKLSAGVSTAPGGYGAPERAGQFAISDHRSFDDVARAVRDAGLEPVAATRTNMGR